MTDEFHLVWLFTEVEEPIFTFASKRPLIHHPPRDLNITKRRQRLNNTTSTLFIDFESNILYCGK